jgi:V/A-type H+-transporting ATPase subunit K
MILMSKARFAVIVLVAATLGFLFASNPVFAQQEPADEAWVPIGAGIAMGLAGLGAGLGMGIAASAAFAAMVDRPEISSTAILLIVLIEAIGIYGLVVAFMIIII